MLVKATYIFKFEPDTSDLDGIIIDKKGFSIDLTKRELEYMLLNKEIEVSDFEFEVIDDGDDHKIDD